MRSRPEALVDARVEALFLPVSFVQILEVFRLRGVGRHEHIARVHLLEWCTQQIVMVRLLLQFYPCLAIVERWHVIHRRTGFEEDVLAAVVGWLHWRAQHWEVIGIRRNDGVGAAVRRTVAPVVPLVPFIGRCTRKPSGL